jgi:NAD(P)-dependent dehydrogenase (short-subunit alcohol dehydrogenase family)
MKTVTTGDPRLEGRNLVVTGASRGIGLATARALASAGGRIIGVSRAGERLDTAVASLGNASVAVPCDLSNPHEIDRAVKAVIDACDGPPDALVQAAGVFPLAVIEETPPDEFDAALQVNLLGPYRFAQPLVAHMRTRGKGHVVTIGSVADRKAFTENVAYAASKFGARAVHEVMREEFRGSGVRVSLVSPGPVDTTIWDAIDPDHRQGFTPRAMMLRPEVVADAVLFVLTRGDEANVDELRLSRT